MGKRPARVALTLGLTLLAASAMADNSLGDYFSYSGFGTAGLARTNTNEAAWVQSIQTAGATENFDYKTDSKLAVQGTVTPTQWLSGTAQVLTEQRYGPDLTTEFEWAFLKVKPLPGLSVRGGKMELPTFLISDTRNVGYANPWLRAPNEVYGQAVFDTYKGFDATYEHAVGPYSLSFNALAGEMETVTPAAPGLQIRLNAHQVHGFNATLDLDVITLRVGRVTTMLTSEIFGITSVESSWTFDSVGAIYDHGNLLLQSEFIERRTQLPQFDVNGMYLLGGYHLGKWLPYAIYSRGEVIGGAAGAIPSTSNHSSSLGVRVDLFKNIDIKAQVEHDTGYRNGDPFFNQSPTFSNDADVFSLVVDFVF